jgi:hypothetical protein
VAAAGAVLLVFVWWAIATVGGGGDGDGDPGTTTATTGPVEPTVHDTAFVVAAWLPEPVRIDGRFDDWAGVADIYLLQHPIFEDSRVTERLGEDSPARLMVGVDEQHLYLAASVDDDVYAQFNTGDQIWRGDAITINVSAAPIDSLPPTPDRTEVQLTMTPRDANGNPAHAHFVGVDGSDGFIGATTDQPIDIAGIVEPDGSWTLEAAIPLEVLAPNAAGVTTSSSDPIAVLFAVFDNDGENGPDDPRQTVILANVNGAGFQAPQTWGRLTEP